MKTLRIFHVDDEPDRVSWIPEALRNAHYVKHPNFLPTEDQWEEEDDDKGRQTFSFVLKEWGVDKRDVQLCYVLVNHEDLLKDDDLSNAVIVLDVMRTVGNELKAVAARHYADLLSNGVSPERIYLLTAYGGRWPEGAFPGLDRGRILEKPIDPGKIVKTLFSVASEIA